VTYLVDPRRQIAKVIGGEPWGVHAHDLHRTFATVPEGLDNAGYTLERLLNHTIHGDLTAGYIVTDVERLRGPMERISRFVSAAMGTWNPRRWCRWLVPPCRRKQSPGRSCRIIARACPAGT
jgi:hypothetical protein